MTQAKAKMYKTAVIAEDVDSYKKGDIVGVHYLGKASFGGFRFRVNADYLGKPEICLSDSQLESFVL